MTARLQKITATFSYFEDRGVIKRSHKGSKNRQITLIKPLKKSQTPLNNSTDNEKSKKIYKRPYKNSLKT
jgi:hypothetical protein